MERPAVRPRKLKTNAGREELFDLATNYYRITHDAIRRYERHHLILGDRYEAARPIADEVIQAAEPFVDVLSFQHFATPDQVTANLNQWQQKTGKPVLLADHAAVIRHPDGLLSHDGAGYARMLETLRQTPGCIGYHLCGAYLRNETPRTCAARRIRNTGLRIAEIHRQGQPGYCGVDGPGDRVMEVKCQSPTDKKCPFRMERGALGSFCA